MNRFGLVGLLLVGCVVAACLIGGMIAAPTPTALAAPIAAPPPVAPVDSKPTNPVVEPGKVHWHPTTSAAFAAAKASKKPVLVFHMMGQLDHQFC
jgi:hypothetical protein